MAVKSEYQMKTIKDIVIGEITENKMFLPAIQRKYVWEEEDILKLFDSIMLGYPIGTFLFWERPKITLNSKVESYYSFIKDYDVRTGDNTSAVSHIQPAVFKAVLDGQQRLTTLNIALQGSITLKVKGKKKNDDGSYLKKELYFNLASGEKNKDDEEALTYNFIFLSNEELGENKSFYKVKDIFGIKNEEMLKKYLDKNYPKDKKAQVNLKKLYDKMCQETIINYFMIAKDKKIDEVLDIFVRINSGGVNLSKTDLLFSTIVSKWDEARMEIDTLIKRINRIGERFQFDSDFIIRTCLCLLDLPISLKVENLTTENIMLLKAEWTKIKAAIETTVNVLANIGFNSQNITSYGAIIPIVYHIYKIKDKKKPDNEIIKKYLVAASLKKIFGASTNSVITSLRTALQTKNDLSLSNLRSLDFRGKSLSFSDKDIEDLFNYQYGDYTFMILSILPEYSYIKLSQNYHQDHIHPKSSFTTTTIKVFDKDKRENWYADKNKLANLNLLEGPENLSKSKGSLIKWFENSDNKVKTKYLPSNKDVSYEFKYFYDFIEKRKEKMKKDLKNILS